MKASKHILQRIVHVRCRSEAYVASSTTTRTEQASSYRVTTALAVFTSKETTFTPQYKTQTPGIDYQLF